MTRKEFEKTAREALDSLPAKFKNKLENVHVVIDDRPPQGANRGVLGLYEGVSLKERTGNYSLVMHDKITLFKCVIEEDCKARGVDVRKEIRHTVLHEIAHHFGIPDERLEELGLY